MFDIQYLLQAYNLAVQAVQEISYDLSPKVNYSYFWRSEEGNIVTDNVAEMCSSTMLFIVNVIVLFFCCSNFPFYIMDTIESWMFFFISW